MGNHTGTIDDNIHDMGPESDHLRYRPDPRSPYQQYMVADRISEKFREAMVLKVYQCAERGRYGWETCPPEVLRRMLRESVEKGDPVDVANLAMMLWHLDARTA